MSQTLEKPQTIDPSRVDSILASLEPNYSEPGISMKTFMPGRADLPLAVAGIGAASAAGLASYLPQIPSFMGIPSNVIAELAIGWGIYKVGGGYNPLAGAFGGGVVIAAFADLARQFGLYLKPKGGAPTTTPTGWGRPRMYTVV